MYAAQPDTGRGCPSINELGITRNTFGMCKKLNQNSCVWRSYNRRIQMTAFSQAISRC
jgi:hypothetical protein